MADLHEWLSRLKQYGERVASQYMNGAQETQGLPAELAAKRQMMQQAQTALDPQMAPVPTTGDRASSLSPQPMMQPYAPAQSGYQPIGGQNALDQLYQGHPPDLRKPRYAGSGVTTKQDSGPGF